MHGIFAYVKHFTPIFHCKCKWRDAAWWRRRQRRLLVFICVFMTRERRDNDSVELNTTQSTLGAIMVYAHEWGAWISRFWIFDNVVGRPLARCSFFSSLSLSFCLSFHFSPIVWVVKWAAAAGCYNIVIIIIIMVSMDRCKDEQQQYEPNIHLALCFGVLWLERVGAAPLCWFDRVRACVCVSVHEVIIDHVDDARVSDSNTTRAVAAPRTRQQDNSAMGIQWQPHWLCLFDDSISRHTIPFIKWDAVRCVCCAPCARQTTGAPPKQNKSTYKLNNGPIHMRMKRKTILLRTSDDGW